MSESALVIVTWNVQWGRGVDGVVDLARTIEHARALGNFDVLCLQEVADNFPGLAGNDARDQFAEIAALLPGFTAIEGCAVDIAAPEGGRRRFGNLILSRLPVTSARRVALPWPADPRRDSMPRLLLEATVETARGPLRIGTTHLEYYSEVQRKAQVRRIRELHEEACERALHPPPERSDANPTFEMPPQATRSVLVGDFNFQPASAEYEDIQRPIAEGPRYRDAWSVVHGERRHAPTFCVHDRKEGEKPYCCDYAFVSEDVAIDDLYADVHTQASDHQPLRLTLA